MSKTQKEKVIVKFEEVPVLAELGVDDLIKKFRARQLEEATAQLEVDRINKRRKAIGTEIEAALEAIRADSVEYVSGKLSYKATLVKGEPSTQTDEEKLKIALMKIAKLDAKMIEKVFDAAQVDVPAKRSYVLVTAQEIG